MVTTSRNYHLAADATLSPALTFPFYSRGKAWLRAFGKVPESQWIGSSGRGLRAIRRLEPKNRSDLVTAFRQEPVGNTSPQVDGIDGIVKRERTQRFHVLRQ